jgi:N-acetylneuraminic acid mutarotase
MPTERYDVSVLHTGTALIVAGGDDDKGGVLKKVEVLNTETRQWHTAADLPQPLSHSSIKLCGDVIYLLGGGNKRIEFINSVYSCSLTSLLFSTGSVSLGERLMNTLIGSNKGSPWNRVADLPINRTTAVSLHGRLLVIGGYDSDYKPTTAVHIYEPTTDSWKVISHMTIPRNQCLSAVLPDNQLMVVGGSTTGGADCDSVEFGKALIYFST